MTDRDYGGDSIKARLDQLIDALNAERAPIHFDDDPELADLLVALRSSGGPRPAEWPDDGFPRRMAARLSAELRLAGRAGKQAAGAGPVDHFDAPSVNGVARDLTAEEEFNLTVPRHHSRLRAIAQLAAAIAGFALLAFVLVAVFRSASDSTSLGVSPGETPNQIAFVKSVDGNAEIFLANADGSEQINLTNHPANDTMPAWSPDGERIAFVSDRSGSDRLYVMEADGSYIREISPPYMYDQAPDGGWHLRNLAWSPDGSMIALMRFATGSDARDAKVLIVAANGIGLRIVDMDSSYPELAFDQTPVWSPDSQWLAFEGRSQQDTRVIITSVSSYMPFPLAVGSGASWSASGEMAIPDGDGVMIARLIEDSRSVDEIRRLSIPGPGSVMSAVWSPDETQLALTIGSISGPSIWTSSSDGTEYVEVPESASGIYPVWSPDGAYLAYFRVGAAIAESEGYELVVVSAEDLTTVTTIDTSLTGPFLSPPAWRPVPTESDESEPGEATASPPSDQSTPAPDIPEAILNPPLARLQAPDTLIEGYLGSYTWQFSDPQRTLAYIEAPFVLLTGDPASIAYGVPLAISLDGEDYSTPPLEIEVAIYNHDENTFTDPRGQPGGDLAFNVRTEPIQRLLVDPADPSFIVTVPPGRYAVSIEGRWGPHPDHRLAPNDLFVTWVFDIMVTETTISDTLPLGCTAEAITGLMERIARAVSEGDAAEAGAFFTDYGGFHARIEREVLAVGPEEIARTFAENGDILGPLTLERIGILGPADRAGAVGANGEFVRQSDGALLGIKLTVDCDEEKILVLALWPA